MSSTETKNTIEEKCTKQFTTLQQLEESFGILQSQETQTMVEWDDKKDLSNLLVIDTSKDNLIEEKEKDLNELIWNKLKLLDDNNGEKLDEKMEEDEKSLEHFSQEQKPLKIRYTRQYLLDHKTAPLSMEFPDCLLKYLCSGEVPLREEESYDSRKMDHILFYTSLPYTRMRSSLNACTKRRAFNLCY